MSADGYQIPDDLQGRIVWDALAWARWAFPWGQTGTALEDWDWVDAWQEAVLHELSLWLLDSMRARARRESYPPFQYRVSSGHGIGKGALTAIIILYLMARGVSGFRGVVTANTDNQLKNKTWAELRKWWQLYRQRHLYQWTATKFFIINDPDTFVEAISWSEHNAQAFAGLHGPKVPGGTLVLFDEASTIPQAIYTVAEGALTTDGAMQFLFGNPTEPTGPFIDRSPGGLESRGWRGMEVDSRTVKATNKVLLAEWERDRGENSDFFRVRVRGLPPQSGSAQFIKLPIIEDAMRRRLKPAEYRGAARRIGVDVAGGGDDETTIIQRKGLKVFRPWGTVEELDPMELALIINEMVQSVPEDDPVCEICVDVTGNRAVAFALRNIGLGDLVVECVYSETPDEPLTYLNVRAEIWGRMKSWMPGADLPNHARLRADLSGPKRVTPKRRGTDFDVVQLESKADMAKRGLLSPDYGDALANTFRRGITDEQVRRATNVRRQIVGVGGVVDSSAGY